jgi:ketosteroid isomerase-like protein
MSEENVMLLHGVFDAFNRRDIDAFLTLCDPDVEFISYWLQVEGGGSYRGHDGVRDWWERLLEVYPDFTAEVEDVRDLGDRTITRVWFHGHGVASDVPIGQTMWQVAEFPQGQIIGWRFVTSEVDALEAAGLRE